MRSYAPPMRVTQSKLPGVFLVEPRIFPDDRGYFLETYNRARYAAAGIDVELVQDNHSRSVQGTLRGLHYQNRMPQAKLVWAVEGVIWDVAVDVRPGSETYGQWVGYELDAEKKHQLFVPAGFAHGFCVLSEIAQVMYKCSDVYDPEGQAGVIWNDPTLAIEWPVAEPLLSPKDAALPLLADAAPSL